MKIEVLFFEGCPNHRPTVERVNEILREEGLEAVVAEINVGDDATAQAVSFLGSPTVRINGLDAEPSARASREYGMMCRTYAHSQGREGAPSKDLLRAALREALTAEDGGHACCHAPAAPVVPPSQDSRRPAWFVASSVVGAVLASFCCVLPIVFALTGVSILGASALFAAWRPYLLAATFGFVGLGFYFAYRRPKEECAPDSICAVPASRRRTRMTLWLATVAVIAFAAFPYYSGAVAELLLSGNNSAGESAEPVSPSLTTASLTVEGMHCEACATAIENKLSAVPGVHHVKVSWELGAAEIEFDAQKASVDQLERAVREAGYQIRKKT